MQVFLFLAVALAGIALLIAVARRRRGGEGSYGAPVSERIEDMGVWAYDQAIQDAQENHHRTLDGSDGSIEEVEGILGRIEKIGKDRAGRLKPGVTGMAMIYGLYIGEVIRRRHGGVWGTDHPIAGPRSYPIVSAASTAFPVSWAYKRIANGSEDDVWYKFRMVVLAGGGLGAGGRMPVAQPDDGTPSADTAR